jgi:hypothetical protein
MPSGIPNHQLPSLADDDGVQLEVVGRLRMCVVHREDD